MAEGNSENEELERVLIDDPLLRHHAEVCRDDPEMLQLLLGSVTLGGAAELGAVEKAVRATRALANWAVSGFSNVSEYEFEERLAACSICPHAQNLVENIGFGAVGKHTHCGLCGCPIHRKARMATEKCPDIEIGANGRWPSTRPQASQ